MSNSSFFLITFFLIFINTDNLSSKLDWKGQRPWERIFWSKNRSWKLARASCFLSRHRIGSRRSSRRSWRSLFRPSNRTRSHPPRDRARYYSSARGTSQVGGLPCWGLSAAKTTELAGSKDVNPRENAKRTLCTCALLLALAFLVCRLLVK